MNRLLRLLIAVGLPLFAFVGFALATNRGATPPDRGQTLLYTYISRTANTGQSARIVQTVASSRPSNFIREISDYSLGYGVYYQTTDLVQRSTIEPTPAVTTVGFAVPGSSEGGRALRYPPDYASCVLLERGAKFEVVVLAEHHDTWNADWVLHTSTLSPQELIETLGCDLNLLQ